MRPLLLESASLRLDETALESQDDDRVALRDELARLERSNSRFPPTKEKNSATPSRPVESMVIFAPAGPEEVRRLSAIGYGLSPSEQEVVDLAVHGASTRQISQVLYISEYTVKDHLKNIFGKVGVRGRRALVKQLYLNTFLP
jgi:DNA-binding CsgD family transcriptional regulator